MPSSSLPGVMTFTSSPTRCTGCWSTRLRPACPPVADLYERGISLSGLSKSFALPGLRIGWLAMRDADLLARCLAFHDYTTICASAPSEILGIMALRAQEQIVARNLAIIGRNRAEMAQFCVRHGDLITWLPPQAARWPSRNYVGDGNQWPSSAGMCWTSEM